MTAHDVPADVRAAAHVLYRLEHHPDDPDLWNELSPNSRAGFERDAAAITAASDAVRLAGAGDVVERLLSFVREGLFAVPTIVADAQEAATLIATLRADNARLVAERGAAREAAIREAADVAHKEGAECDAREESESGPSKATWGVSAATCRIVRQRILALIPTEGGRDAG